MAGFPETSLLPGRAPHHPTWGLWMPCGLVLTLHCCPSFSTHTCRGWRLGEEASAQHTVGTTEKLMRRVPLPPPHPHAPEPGPMEVRMAGPGPREQLRHRQPVIGHRDAGGHGLVSVSKWSKKTCLHKPVSGPGRVFPRAQQSWPAESRCGQSSRGKGTGSGRQHRERVATRPPQRESFRSFRPTFHRISVLLMRSLWFPLSFSSFCWGTTLATGVARLRPRSSFQSGFVDSATWMCRAQPAGCQ